MWEIRENGVRNDKPNASVIMLKSGSGLIGNSPGAGCRIFDFRQNEFLIGRLPSNIRGRRVYLARLQNLVPWSANSGRGAVACAGAVVLFIRESLREQTFC